MRSPTIPTQLEERKKNGERLRTLRGGPEQTEEEERFSTLLSKIAAEHNIESVTAIALACAFRLIQLSFPTAESLTPRLARRRPLEDSLRLSHHRVRCSLLSFQVFDIS